MIEHYLVYSYLCYLLGMASFLCFESEFDCSVDG